MAFDYNEYAKEQMAEQEELFLETRKTIIETAGKPVEITTVHGGHTLTIWADDGNTGDIYIGGRDISSTNSIVLAPGATIDLNLTQGVYRKLFVRVFADAATSSDSIRWMKL